MSCQQGPRLHEGLSRAIADVSDAYIHDLLLCPLVQIQDTDERRYALRLFCTGLVQAVHCDEGHYDQLDRHLSSLLPRGEVSPSKLNREESLTPDLPSKVQGLLSRLPDVPQRSFSLPLNNSLMRQEGSTLWDGIRSGQWASKYVLPEARSQLQQQPTENAESILNLISRMQDVAWDNLYVTKYLDSNSLKLACAFSRQSTCPDLNLAQRTLEYVNLLSELFDEFQGIYDAVSFGIEDPFQDDSEEGLALRKALFPRHRDGHAQAMAIIKVFLWSTWQRSVMLHFYYIVGVQLTHGYSSTWNSLLAVRGVHELESMTKDDYQGPCTEYLCNWAFELLRTSRTSVGLDFRRMILRFDNHFRHRDGRCIAGSVDACEGGLPETCERFTAAESAAQSAHASTCDGQCKRITWEETSYLDCVKPAAVVASDRSVCLEYAPVSLTTLGISHVWGHGQGGRPETGINTCLHARYCRLAYKFGCTTYWIDAAGIPSETNLRRQAIGLINEIFVTAKATLVVDRDIQTIEVTQPAPSIAQLETVISTLLVSDWAVRGWTLLEGIRGSGNILLLCKNDLVINFRQSLVTLHERGAIDIAVLLGSTQHLIPHSEPASSKSVEEAGYLLSQRHTSWPEDVIICWSLLRNTPVEKRAADLWKHQDRVRSGFLLSSAPRVNGVQGLGWAPATPYIRPVARVIQLDDGRKQEYTVRFPCYDGDGSLFSRITSQGLSGRWRVLGVDSAFLADSKEMCCHMTQYQDEEVNFHDSELVYAHPDEALAWRTMRALLGQGAEVRLVRALADDGRSPYVGSSQRGENFGLIAAVCHRLDQGLAWKWDGVYSWQESENYEGWEIVEMLIE